METGSAGDEGDAASTAPAQPHKPRGVMATISRGTASILMGKHKDKSLAPPVSYTALWWRHSEAEVVDA